MTILEVSQIPEIHLSLAISILVFSPAPSATYAIDMPPLFCGLLWQLNLGHIKSSHKKKCML